MKNIHFKAGQGHRESHVRLVHVNAASGSYYVYIGVDIRHAGAYAKNLHFDGKAFIITDSNVDGLYGEAFAKALEDEGFDVGKIVIPAGEEHKRLETVRSIYDALHAHGMTRSDVIFALGGGVTGDMAGFAAGTYMRGIPYIQVPTTLLAQIDSSVGGKTGVDLEYGKNLVGMFNQPAKVLIDPCVLDTLDPKAFADGMAEAVKYGLIRDAALFEKLAGEGEGPDITEMIQTCVEIKNKVVSNDERDTGERMILNFGHTIGHALEKCGNYTKYTHGQAVAIGMVREAAIGEAMGETPEHTVEAVIKAVTKYGLPTSSDESPEEIFNALLTDKKKSGGDMNMILLESIGNAVIRKIPAEDLRELLTRTQAVVSEACGALAAVE